MRLAVRPALLTLAITLTGVSAAARADDGAAADRCTLAERNPETASIFDPACNPFMVVAPRRTVVPLEPLQPFTLPAMQEPAPSRVFRRPPSLASSTGLARTPAPWARGATFHDAPLTLPASFREDRLKLDARAQLVRTEPDRVGIALGADAEYVASPILTLRARTAGRPTADRFALTFGAAAELDPAPLLKLRAQTDLEEQRPRYQFGARAQLVPRRLDLEMVGQRQPGAEPDGWTWRTQLTYRAPFLD